MGAGSNGKCQQCPKYSYSNRDGNNCLYCKKGSYVNSWQTGCIPCNDEWIVNKDRDKCDLCEPGYIPYKWAAHWHEECWRCPDGEVVDNAGTSCICCKPGWYRDGFSCKKLDNKCIADGCTPYTCCNILTERVNVEHTTCIKCPGVSIPDPEDIYKCKYCKITEIRHLVIIKPTNPQEETIM